MNLKRISILMLIFGIFYIGCGKSDKPESSGNADMFNFKVQFVLGVVKLNIDGMEKIASQNDKLKKGDVVITGAKSVVNLMFGDSGLIRINENSRVTIAGIADKAGSDTLLEMDNGKVYLTLSKLKGTGFKVKTPTAVAGVRGTSFTVESNQKGAKMSVVKGTVSVNPVKDGKVIEDKSVSVESGKKTDYIDRAAVEKIINGKMEIPVMEMTPAEKIEVSAEVKEIKIEEIPEISLELREEIKDQVSMEDTSVVKEEPVKKSKSDSEAAKRAAEEKRIIEEKKRAAEEEKRTQERLMKEAAEKKAKEEKIKKERASNIPTM